jgi:hypothetical protein
MYLLIYSKLTNYVDSHMVIAIFLIYSLYFMLFLTDGYVLFVFDSRY